MKVGRWFTLKGDLLSAFVSFPEDTALHAGFPAFPSQINAYQSSVSESVEDAVYVAVATAALTVEVDTVHCPIPLHVGAAL